jgi:hypothetical protein
MLETPEVEVSVLQRTPFSSPQMIDPHQTNMVNSHGWHPANEDAAICECFDMSHVLKEAPRKTSSPRSF